MGNLYSCEFRKLFHQRTLFFLVMLLAVLLLASPLAVIFLPDHTGNTRRDYQKAYDAKLSASQIAGHLSRLTLLKEMELAAYLPEDLARQRLEYAQQKSGLSVEELQELDSSAILLFREAPSQELALFQAAQAQTALCDAYPGFLASVQEQAQTVKISVLYQGNRYAQALATKISENYAPLTGLTLPCSSPLGVQTALGTALDDALICLLSAALCLFLFLSEREQGTVRLIFSTRNGKTATYWAKILLALTFPNGVVLLCAIYRTVLAATLLGLGDLARPIQTIPEFYASPFALHVGQLLMMAPLVKMACVSLVVCIAALLCTLLDKSMALGAMAAVAAASVAANGLIPDTSVFQAAKYWNPVSFFCLENLFGNALYLKFGEVPFGYPWVLLLTLLLGLPFLLLAGVRQYCRWSRHWAIHSGGRRAKGTKRRSANLFSFELRKLLFAQRGAVLLLALIVLQPLLYHSFRTGLGADEFRYEVRMKQLQGAFTTQTHESLHKELADLQAEYTALIEQGNAPLYEAELQERVRCMERVTTVSDALFQMDQTNRKVCYLYETGWEALCGLQTIVPRSQFFLIALGLVLLLPGIFTLDRELGMDRLCAVTGRERMLKSTRWCLAFFIATVVHLINYVPKWIFVFRTFSLPLPLASANSIVALAQLPNWVAVSAVAIVYQALLFLRSLVCAGMVIAVSAKMRTYLSAVITCLAAGGICYSVYYLFTS